MNQNKKQIWMSLKELISKVQKGEIIISCSQCRKPVAKGREIYYKYKWYDEECHKNKEN